MARLLVEHFFFIAHLGRVAHHTGHITTGAERATGPFDDHHSQLLVGLYLLCKAFEAYGREQISERHRHRFEVSNRFRAQLEEKGLLVSGKHKMADTGADLVEIVEIPGHPWFLGCQFHPEFLSKPLNPHPLFAAFIKATKENAAGVKQPLLKGLK